MPPILLWTLLALAPSRAQEPAPPPAAEVGPRLPRVLQTATAAYPPDALAQGLGGQVLLEVDISAEGKVVQVLALESSDPRFDVPAEDALRAFRFAPALDVEGKPADARIQYRYVFRAEKALPPSVEGSLRDASSGAPLASFLVTARSPDGVERYASTGDDGSFRFVGLAPGPWQVRVSGGALYGSKELDLSVAEDRVQQVALELQREAPSRERVDLVITVEAQAAPAQDQVTERVLSAEEIAFLPGTSGDVVKSVQNLPGVARAPSGIGQLIIRGTPPEDSEFGLDGSPIPLVFHFAGLTTVLSTESIAEVAYLPGSYGVRYGRALGGYVDLRLVEGIPESDRNVASVDVYQAQLFSERRVGERTVVTVSGRRSYIDTVLTPLLSQGDFTVQAPRYWDAQARLVHQTHGGDTWDVLFLASDDRFRFLGKDADGEEQTLAAFATRFQKLRLRWLKDLSGGWDLESTALVGPEAQTFAFVRDSEAYEKRLTVALREEVSHEADRLETRLGADLLCGRDSYLYDVAFYPAGEEGQTWFCAPAPYGEVTVRAGRFLLTPGLRSDFLLFPSVSVASVDPRLGARWVASDATTVKAGTGIYSQLPTFRELNPDSDGNPDLGAEHAWQTTLGVEHQITPTLQGSVEAFTGALYDLVVGREDRFSFFTGPPIRRDFDVGPYANEGTGFTCGVEALLRYTDDVTLAQLAATFSHSERTGRDGVSQLFEYDQPVNLNLLASRELNDRWRLGSRIRYGSGNPYSPVVNRIYDLDQRSWIPLYDTDQVERVKPFFALDVRVDRTWLFRRWDLTAYLDVQNATWYRNVEVMAWSEDYSEEQPVEGLPTVPSFGVKGEW